MCVLMCLSKISDWPAVAVRAVEPIGPQKPLESPTDGHKTQSGWFLVCVPSLFFCWSFNLDADTILLVLNVGVW